MRNNKFLNIMILFAIFINSTLLGNTNSYLENIYNDKIKIISTYDNKLPDDINFNLKYNDIPEILDYVFITSRSANLREKPETNSKILKKYTYDTKLKLLQKIKYDANYWYYVEDENNVRGYIAASITSKRNFRFEMALKKVMELESFINNSIDNGFVMASTNTYSPNPNHENLSWERDKYDTGIDQNLVGYNSKGEKIFIPDRSVLKILETKGDMAIVKTLSIPEEIEVPKNKLASTPNIKKNFKKVITIDLQNQNFTVFEKNGNDWEIISFVYSKTGIDSQLGFETPKGFFVVPNAKYVMAYNDESGQKQGTARFAIRFSGGGYLHGTPINVQEEVNKEFFMKQKEFTLGTITGTRKCVRTTEEHARFLFDWIIKTPNKSSNDQRPDENVYFIVF